ncbi:hypothetical protein [Planctomicrobium sp. SH527]|uniref:hypothetical protein n=1 Tax=Planctomicrobium sp. SH527 TaxID=3448123 RepID=UPI003F5BCF17
MYVVNSEKVGNMQLQSFSGIEIFRPRPVVEQLIRDEAERNLRESYSSGTYRDPATINEILKHQFNYFHEQLDSRLPFLASSDLIIFLLHLYDQTSRIERKYREGSLSPDELKMWKRCGPTMRRGIKYLAERVALLGRDDALADSRDRLRLTEECTIYAEQLVELYVKSDQTHMLFSDQTELTIQPAGAGHPLDLKVRDFARYDIHSRISRDGCNWIQFFQPPPFHLDTGEHAAILDPAFERSFGFKWSNAMHALKLIIAAEVVQKGNFDISFCPRDLVVEILAKNIPGATKQKAGQFLEGFLLPVTKMLDEGRLVWKPKQEYRALRRGFFEFPHPTGPHIIWSRELAKECLITLTVGVVFQRFPPEWKNADVEAGLAKLSNKAGVWFEGVTMDNLRKVGVVGLKSLKSVGMGDKRIAIPADIGELDFLGYHPGWRLLVLLECKMVGEASEPTFMRKDIDTFVKGEKSYVNKFRRKLGWVQNHLNEVCAGIESIFPNVGSISPQKLVAAIVTLNPTIASSFITDLPCVSLTELMLDIQECGTWPYDTGLYDC